MHIGQTVVAQYISSAEQMVILARAMASITTTKYDDEVVEFIAKVISSIKLNNSQPYMAAFIDRLLHLFSGTSEEVADKIKAATTALDTSLDVG